MRTSGSKEAKWDAKALELWELLGSPRPPIDPYLLAHQLDLTVRLCPYTVTDSYLLARDGVIGVAAHLSGPRRAFCVGHELLHWLMPEVEREFAIHFMTMSLFLPSVHVDAVLDETWDLFKFCDRLAPHFSLEVNARRLLSRRPNARISIWKEGLLIGAYTWPANKTLFAYPDERLLAEQLFRDRPRECVSVHPRLYAVADDTDDGRYVVTVADLETLALSAHDTLVLR